jgi:AMP nucleosidase
MTPSNHLFGTFKIRTPRASTKEPVIPPSQVAVASALQKADLNLEHLTHSDLPELSRLDIIQKSQIVKNWLPRYTDMPLDKFGKYILLVNFKHYLDTFAELYNVPIYGANKSMQAATYDDITIINFGMGSPNAGIIMDLLTAIEPKACLFLGKCGGLKNNIPIGSLLLPIGAIRGEGTSNDYMPKKVPALPAFQLEKAVSHTIREHHQDYFSGVVYTTNKRVWEHSRKIRKRLIKMKATAVDMETATIFVAGFSNSIPTGALLLVSDQPLKAEGIKTESSDKTVTANYGEIHLKIGIDSLKQIIESGESMKHLKFE